MNDVKGVWRTVRGRRVFIAEGQDLYTAMEKSGKFKNLGKRGTYQASKNTFKNETNSEIMKSGQGTRAYNDMNKEYGLDRRDIEEETIKNGNLYSPKHNKEEAQRRMKKKYNYSRESNYDESKDKIAQYRYERYAYENNLKRFGDELEKEDYKRAKGKIDAYKKRKGIKSDKTWRDELREANNKTADELWEENRQLYKKYAGFADTGDALKNQEVQKAHKKWLQNREIARAKENMTPKEKARSIDDANNGLKKSTDALSEIDRLAGNSERLQRLGRQMGLEEFKKYMSRIKK